MENVSPGFLFDSLINRREQITLTLKYIESQLLDVEKNAEWKDDASRTRRSSLLNYLNSWYLTEIDQVEKALSRINEHTDGICLACDRPISADWLESIPEGVFCRNCYELRASMEQVESCCLLRSSNPALASN